LPSFHSTTGPRASPSSQRPISGRRGGPDPSEPQQIHFDVMVDDLDTAGPRVLALGARRLASAGDRAQVYADPAGHPFCLIPRPGWAAPIDGSRPTLFDCHSRECHSRQNGARSAHISALKDRAKA
jgi:hypothetical protein